MTKTSAYSSIFQLVNLLKALAVMKQNLSIEDAHVMVAGHIMRTKREEREKLISILSVAKKSLIYDKVLVNLVKEYLSDSLMYAQEILLMCPADIVVGITKDLGINITQYPTLVAHIRDSLRIVPVSETKQ